MPTDLDTNHSQNIDRKHDEFMRLFLQYESSIYAYIRASVFSEADASDILQETSMVLWRKFDEFERGTHFDRWAIRTAKFQIMYHHKKNQRDHLIFSEQLLDLMEEDEAEESGWSDDVRDQLRACLSKLPDIDQVLVSQRYAEGQTGRSIAKLLGRSESSISRALSRINVSLMRCMKISEVETQS